MAKITDHNKMRRDLIDGAIKSIATFGFDGTTTKTISEYCNMNESYIYRYYLDRDDLIDKAFKSSDNNVFAVLKENLKLLDDKSKSSVERFWNYINAMYDYYTDDLMYSAFYIRVYYSPAYGERLCADHKLLVKEFVDEMVKHVKELHNAYSTLHAIFTLSLDYCLRLTFKQNEDTPQMRKESGEQIYAIAVKNIVLCEE